MREKLAQALAAVQQRVATPADAVKAHQAQGAESESPGHGTRLAPRQRALAVWAKGGRTPSPPKPNALSMSSPWGHLERERSAIAARCAMALREQGKPICVRLRDMSP